MDINIQVDIEDKRGLNGSEDERQEFKQCVNRIAYSVRSGLDKSIVSERKRENAVEGKYNIMEMIWPDPQRKKMGFFIETTLDHKEKIMELYKDFCSNDISIYIDGVELTR